MTPRDDLSLLIAYLHDELPADERGAFEARLVDDALLARRLLEIAGEEAALVYWARGLSKARQIDATAASFEPSKPPCGAAEPWNVPAPAVAPAALYAEAAAAGVAGDAFAAPSDAQRAAAPRSPWPSPLGWSLVGAGAAMAVALLIAVGLWLGSPNGGVARVTSVEGVEWADGQTPLGVGASVAPGGTLAIRQGTLEIECAGGVRLRLTGVSDFELHGQQTGSLHEGRLTVDVSNGDRHFAVTTPTMTVTDRGTIYGVRVGRDRETDVHVFDGEVEARCTLAAAQDQPPLALRMLQAVRFDQAGKLRDWIKPSYEDFKAPRLAPGVVRTSEHICWLPRPPTSLAAGALTDDERVFLIREQGGVTLGGPVAATFDGRSRGTRSAFDRNVAMLPAGLRVDVYLLHFDSARAGRPLKGTVEFDRPIVGVIARGKQLAATDHYLGLPGVKYETANVQQRGLSGAPGPVDVLNFAQMPRELSVWFARHEGISEVRILVESATD